MNEYKAMMSSAACSYTMTITLEAPNIGEAAAAATREGETCYADKWVVVAVWHSAYYNARRR